MSLTSRFYARWFLTKFHSVFVWVDMFPLESTRRILNLLHVDSSSWKFLPNEEVLFMKTSTWSCVKSDRGKSISQHALCLFLMAPWALSATDLQEFARGQSVRSHASHSWSEEPICYSFPTAPHRTRWKINHRALFVAWNGSGARFLPNSFRRQDSTDYTGRSGIPASLETVRGSLSPLTHIGSLEFSLLVSTFRKVGG